MATKIFEVPLYKGTLIDTISNVIDTNTACSFNKEGQILVLNKTNSHCLLMKPQFHPFKSKIVLTERIK